MFWDAGVEKSFLIICSNTNTSQAYEVAEKLRKSIQDYDFGKVGKVTSSFGVSEYKSGDINSDIVVKRADDALYISKDTGRNVVTAKD